MPSVPLPIFSLPVYQEQRRNVLSLFLLCKSLFPAFNW